MKDLARTSPTDNQMHRAVIADRLFELHNDANKAIGSAVERLLLGDAITPTVELMKLAIEQALKETMIEIRSL